MKSSRVALAGMLAILATLPAQAADTRRITTPASGSVAIYRDDWGVPHIYATREEDGYFGLGYAHAEDQLALLLRLFLWVEGRSAEAFGRTGPDGVGPPPVQSDIESLRWRHAEEGRKGYARLSPQLRLNYKRWVQGIQRFMEERPEKIPAWAPRGYRLEPWLPVGLSRTIFWGYLASEGYLDCQAGGVKLAAAGLLADRQTRIGSNEWVIGPSRTADHSTIMLSDPHGGVHGREFYEFSMHAGKLDISGFAIGALPLLTHNRHIGWGQTTGAPDVADCFAVKVDPENPTRYAFDRKWKTMSSRDVTVAVKDQPPVTARFEYTDHNGILSAVVAREGGLAYVVSSSYMDAAGLLDEEVYRWNLARSVDELRDAMRILGSYPQNMMAGDREGHLFYIRFGRTPIRPSGYDYTKPVDGSTSATAWKGLHPLENLVQVKDPPQGYMQNANIPPEFMVQGKPLFDPADYPKEIYHDAVHFRYLGRGFRINEVLDTARDFTVEDATRLAFDEKWFGAEGWTRLARELLSTAGPGASERPPEHERVAERLAGFDGVASKDSVAALNEIYWRTALLKRLGPEGIAALSQVVIGKTEPDDAQRQAALGAIADAADAMKKAYGSVDLKYGDVFRIKRQGRSWPLAGGQPMLIDQYLPCRNLESPAFACVLTQRAYLYGPPDEQGIRYATSGSRVLRLMVLGQVTRSYSMHLHGQSDDPQSPHFDDQLRLASEHRLKPTYFNPDELEGHIESVRVLKVPAK